MVCMLYIVEVYSMDNIKCNKCNLIKSKSEFYKYSINKLTLDGQCKECCRIYKRFWCKGNKKHINNTLKQKQQRIDYVNEVKKQGCSKCGYTKCLKALVFHHLDNKNKIDTISNLICKCKNIKVIQEEIDKCILLCQNCHHELHDSLGNYGLNNNKEAIIKT